MEFSELVGKTLTAITGEKGDYDMVFVGNDRAEFSLFHKQDCCEDVEIEDVCGDLKDLIGSPILVAEEVTYVDETPVGVAQPGNDGYDDSFTWTFYKLSTIKGSVTVRWLGTSNGYYSETVDFEQTKPSAPFSNV